jgi:hypothetical protein
MHLRSLTRAGIGLATLGAVALGAAVPAGTPAFAAATHSKPLPHVVGGFVPTSKRVSAAGQGRASIASALPDSVDLRDKAPAVGDQGQIGSCVAWTIAHSLMGYYANVRHSNGAPYAPLYLYMRVVQTGGAPNAGLVPERALAEAQAGGVDTETDYTQGYYKYQSAPSAAEIANATNYRITSWNTLFAGANQGTAARTTIETSIAAGNPVAIGMPVFANFFSMPANSLYNTLTGTSLGGHMVSVFAYDAQGIWIRNQWGTAWGTKGDAHLSWAFVQKDVMGAYTISGLSTTTPAVVLPTVSGLSPASGPTYVPTPVTVTGTNLDKATGVTIGGVSVPFSKVSATQLKVTLPVHAAGSLPLVVATQAGNTTAIPFSYVAPPVPAVTKLSVAKGPTNVGTLITVTGTALVSVTKVSAGGVSVPFARISDSALQVVLPPHAAGTASIQVTTPGGTSPAVAAAQFTWAVPTPVKR